MTPDDKQLQPRKTPRQVRAELTRRRILTAAAHVFAEQGYAAGTTNRIAERAGVSIGSLYQYFPGKDAILVALLGEHLAQETPDLAEFSASPLADAVRAMVHAAVHSHSGDPELLGVLMQQALRWPEIMPMMAELQRQRAAEVHAFLDRHPEVDVADPAIAANLVVTTVGVVTHWLTAAPAALDPVSLEDEMTTMLTRYLTGR
ncbi:TetR/AcrR family transcriptional regulator [Actinoplanes regularis]|uniref:Transcriptional regulator, TetR family n=1 Tax=Actinoplanes regularis TaxID=52697 RepID=A0A239CX46_9ACTN|nr:TetR/AcrR family transcriptional regulator [Actinoplanes regularis]GIE88531.1 putative transcriptional regulator, TetR family protein [Actinoplanes regularis]SNS24499.1 transcriptional regulator, TetR family [Actinoplanes regularis]